MNTVAVKIPENSIELEDKLAIPSTVSSISVFAHGAAAVDSVRGTVLWLRCCTDMA